MHSSNELRLKRALEAAKAEHDAAKAKAAERQRELRRLQKQKQALEHHPDWHKYAIGAERYSLGFTGQMAAACAYLWSLPVDEYRDATAHFAQNNSDTIAVIELDAIKANLKEWTVLGEAIVLRREVKRYWADHRAFGRWQAEHLENTQWRSLAITDRQSWLVERTADSLEIDAPLRLNRGAAHDWLEEHGANVRLWGHDLSAQGRNTITHRQAIGNSPADLYISEENNND